MPSTPIVLVIHGMGTHHLNPVISEEQRKTNIENDEKDKNFIDIDKQTGKTVDGGLTSTQKEIVDGVKETAEYFGFEEFNFNEKVDFREFNYSKELDDIRLKDAVKAQAIVEYLPFLANKGVPEDILSKLAEEIAEADEEKFFWTHWMDVAYYGLAYWGEKIRVDLAVLLISLLKERHETGQEVHIIAHSLGTAILHDTLHKLFKKDAELIAKVPSFDVDIITVDSVYMIANVSRMVNLLNGIGDPHGESSVVNSGTNGCVRRFYNFYNEFDPFTWFKRWDRDIPDGRSERITTVREINTHDLTEYAAAPVLCHSLMTNLLSEDIDDSKEAESVEKHKQNGSINKPYEELKAAFDEVKNQIGVIDKASSLAKLFKATNDVLDAAKKLKESMN